MALITSQAGRALLLKEFLDTHDVDVHLCSNNDLTLDANGDFDFNTFTELLDSGGSAGYAPQTITGEWTATQVNGVTRVVPAANDGQVTFEITAATPDYSAYKYFVTYTDGENDPVVLWAEDLSPTATDIATLQINVQFEARTHVES